MSPNLPFLNELANQGILGIITAISLFANWYFIKKLQDVNDKRVQDAQEFQDRFMDPINAIKNNSELLIGLFTKFLQQSGNKV